MKSNAQSTFQMPCCNLRATHFWGERIFFTVWLTSFGILLHLDPQLRLPDASCSPSHYSMFPHLFSSGRLWVQCECFESWSPSSPTRAHCRVKWTRQHQFPVFIDKEVGVCMYLEVELDYASLPHSSPIRLAAGHLPYCYYCETILTIDDANILKCHSIIFLKDE